MSDSTKNLSSIRPKRNSGKWNVDTVKVMLTCSECGEHFDNFPMIGWNPLWNFCPNCGADMRGINNE